MKAFLNLLDLNKEKSQVRNGGTHVSILRGIDLHLKNTFVVLIHHEGNSLEERRVRAKDLVEYVDTQMPRQTYAVMEATRNWPYFYDELERRLERVELAHPKELKAISTAAVKTDRIDARVLAQLARMNYLPVAYLGKTR